MTGKGRREAFPEPGERFSSPFSPICSPRLGEDPLLHLPGGIIPRVISTPSAAILLLEKANYYHLLSGQKVTIEDIAHRFRNLTLARLCEILNALWSCD
jgi:hypothetical protein